MRYPVDGSFRGFPVGISFRSGTNSTPTLNILLSTGDQSNGGGRGKEQLLTPLLISCHSSPFFCLCSSISFFMSSASTCLTSNPRLRGSAEPHQPWRELDKIQTRFRLHSTEVTQRTCTKNRVWKREKETDFTRAASEEVWHGKLLASLDLSCVRAVTRLRPCCVLTYHFVKEALSCDGTVPPVPSSGSRPAPLSALYLLLSGKDETCADRTSEEFISTYARESIRGHEAWSLSATMTQNHLKEMPGVSQQLMELPGTECQALQSTK